MSICMNISSLYIFKTYQKDNNKQTKANKSKYLMYSDVREIETRLTAQVALKDVFGFISMIKVQE
jgi:hypothetical protein